MVLLRVQASLQHRGLVNLASFGKSLEVQERSINQLRLSFQHQIGRDFSGGRSVHHAVSTEAVGKEETGDVCGRTEYRMVIGRHLVQSRPGALWIDWHMIEARNAIGGPLQNLLDERWLEI